jgi:hypothetical protein
MLTLGVGGASRDCSRLGRRDFVRIGTVGLGALSLPRWLGLRAAAGSSGAAKPPSRSVVLLFLSGGASHIETFDPKPDAPAGVRSVTGTVPTRLSGVHFGGTFPRLARLAHRMAVVRSFQHPITDHVRAIHHVLTAGDANGTSMGSLFTRLRGSNHPRTGMPTYSLLTAPEVDPQYRNERTRVQSASAPGSLGAACSAFDPSAGGPFSDDLELCVPRARLADRRALLESLDRLDRRVDASGQLAGLDRFTEQAYNLILRGARAAFDLSREDPRVLARYDTSAFAVGKKTFRASVLGTQLLLARRLCEAGCGFVTVHSAGWDMHADGNNPGILDGMNMLGPPLDRAVSAFLEDLEARGLADDVLLVITGDFGRTPKVNKRGGRDHWSALSTLALAGGGLRMGQVIGRSDRGAAAPASDPVTPEDLRDTLLYVGFDLGELRVARGLPAEVRAVLERARPIAQLL